MEKPTLTDSMTSVPVSRPASVKVFRSVGEIEPLRCFWSSCIGSRDSDIDIILNELRSNTSILHPHVVGLHRAGQLDALLIGRVVRRQLTFNVGYLNITTPLAKTLVFPYGALRGNRSPENCELLIREVMKALKNREADVAILEHIKVDSPLFCCGKREVGFAVRDRFAPVRAHYTRELPSNVEELQASLSANERQKFRRLGRKLSADFPGQVNFIRVGGVGDLERIFEDVEEVAAKAWQRKLGPGGFEASSALLAKFRIEAERSWLRTYVLYIAGKPAAYWVGVVYQNTFYSDFLGYDPAYEKYSVGTYLLSLVLEDLCLNGVRVLDFGFTEDEYKRRFRNVMWYETTLHLFPPTLNGLKLSLLRAATALISNSSRALVKRMGLMQIVKKVWRRARGS